MSANLKSRVATLEVVDGPGFQGILVGEKISLTIVDPASKQKLTLAGEVKFIDNVTNNVADFRVSLLVNTGRGVQALLPLRVVLNVHDRDGWMENPFS